LRYPYPADVLLVHTNSAHSQVTPVATNRLLAVMDADEPSLKQQVAQVAIECLGATWWLLCLLLLVLLLFLLGRWLERRRRRPRPVAEESE
jgi:hypothetical protein